jgi:hypothetical protein
VVPIVLSTLRPSSNVKAVGVSYSTGSSAFVLLDDSPDDDTTYVRAAAGLQASKAYLHLGLTNLGAVSGTQRIKSTQIRGRVRMHSSDPGHGATLAVRLWDPQSGLGYPPPGWSDQPAGAPDGFTTSNVSTFQPKSGAPHTAPPPLDGAEWTKAIIDRCVLHLMWYYSVGSVHENLRVSELYVDVDIRDQATVSGITVTGHDASTRPTVSWTFNPNADGDEQIAYRVKVFSAAQYGIAGFSPDTSPCTWDSKIRSGAGELLAVERDLQLGVTYKAYVLGAADFNGRRWLTAWATSGTFIPIPTAPAPPTLEVISDPTVPWLRNILKVTSGTNLLSYDDGTFEGSGAGLIDSYVPTNCTLAPSNTQAAHGAWSMRMTASTAANMGASTSGYPTRYKVKGGVSYTALASFRAQGTGRQVGVNIYWYDKAGASISSSVGTTAADNSTGWVQRTITGTSPTNAMYAQVEVAVSAPAAGEQHYVDKVDLHAGSATTWGLPGQVQAGGSTVVEFSHAATGAGNLAPEQLWGGGDPTLGAGGFVASGTYSTVEFDRGERWHGEGSIRWDVRDTTSALTMGWYWGSTAGEDPDPTYVLPAVPGRVYSFAVRAKASQTFSTLLNLQAIDRGGTAVGSPANGGATSITTAWQEFQVVNFTVPAGACWVRARFDNSASVTERSVWVDYLAWNLGATVSADRQPSGQPTVWTPVRGAGEDELVAVDEDGIAYVHDMEVHPGYHVTYRAWNVTTVADLQIASPTSSYVQTKMDSPGSWVLKVAGSPTLAMAVRVQADGYTESRHEEATTYYPLRPAVAQGNGQRPVVVSDFAGGVDGSLQIASLTEDDWALLDRIIATPQTCLLVFPQHGARYVRLLGRSWPTVSLAGSKRLRMPTLEYLEVDRPV